MLYSIDSGKYVTVLPHKKGYEKWRNHLSDEDYARIIDELGRRIDSQEINTAGWIPGHDWTGTVFEPIYYACGRNERQAGMFFGLILFNYLMLRPDAVWGFGRFEKNGVQIESTTYFELKNPPPMNK